MPKRASAHESATSYLLHPTQHESTGVPKMASDAPHESSTGVPKMASDASHGRAGDAHTPARQLTKPRARRRRATDGVESLTLSGGRVRYGRWVPQQQRQTRYHPWAHALSDGSRGKPGSPALWKSC